MSQAPKAHLQLSEAQLLLSQAPEAQLLLSHAPEAQLLPSKASKHQLLLASQSEYLAPQADLLPTNTKHIAQAPQANLLMAEL